MRRIPAGPTRCLWSMICSTAQLRSLRASKRLRLTRLKFSPALIDFCFLPVPFQPPASPQPSGTRRQSLRALSFLHSTSNHLIKCLKKICEFLYFFFFPPFFFFFSFFPFPFLRHPGGSSQSPLPIARSHLLRPAVRRVPPSSPSPIKDRVNPPRSGRTWLFGGTWEMAPRRRRPQNQLWEKFQPFPIAAPGRYQPINANPANNRSVLSFRPSSGCDFK